jgi:hypothetical protein
MMTDHRGWHSRGYLPHFDSPETIQFVTFRLDVEQNPVKAALVDTADKWPWSSAHFRQSS